MMDFYRNDKNKSYALRGKEKPNVIIFAEGQTEAYFLEKWLRNTGYDPVKTAVVCFKGQEKLPTQFRALFEEENFKEINRFGFLLDAEANPAASKIDSIRNMLQKHKLISPEQKMKAGEIIEVDGKRIVAHICPNNLGSGIIEDIVLKEIETTELQPALAAFSAAVNEITGEIPHPKALVQAYIGCRKPGLSGAGHAFTSNVLDVMHPAYSGISDTFTKLLS